MKNIIDFILESKGQRPRYRAGNKPYDAENDELVHNKNIREYKKDLQRLTNFFNEFNNNLDEKYKGLIHAFVFVGNNNDSLSVKVPSFSLDEFIDKTNSDFKKSILQFSGDYKELTKDNVKNYDVLQNPDWMSLCSFEKKVETPRWHNLGYELEIKNDYAYYNSSAGSIYITKEGLEFYPYHDNRTKDLQLVFIMEKDNGVDYGEDWQPDNMIQSICNRANKKHRGSSTFINLNDLGKGNLTGKNFAEAFNNVLANW